MSTGDNGSVWQTDLPGLSAPRRGKVRDIYDLGDRILLVATDRLSAYDHILRPAIPGKGRILTQLTNFWMERLACHRPESPPRDRGRRLSGRASPLCATARRPRSPGEEGRGGALRMRCTRLPRRQRLQGVQRSRHRLRHRAATRPRSGEPARRADLHAGDESRVGSRRERRLSRRSRPASAPRPRAACAS